MEGGMTEPAADNFTLAPKLRFGNAGLRNSVSRRCRDSKRSFENIRSQTGVWERGEWSLSSARVAHDSTVADSSDCGGARDRLGNGCQAFYSRRLGFVCRFAPCIRIAGGLPGMLVRTARA